MPRREIQDRQEDAKRQRQRLEWYGYKTRNAKDCQQPQKIRWEARNGCFPKASGGEWTP